MDYLPHTEIDLVKSHPHFLISGSTYETRVVVKEKEKEKETEKETERDSKLLSVPVVREALVLYKIVNGRGGEDGEECFRRQRSYKLKQNGNA